MNFRCAVSQYVLRLRYSLTGDAKKYLQPRLFSLSHSTSKNLSYIRPLFRFCPCFLCNIRNNIRKSH